MMNNDYEEELEDEELENEELDDGEVEDGEFDDEEFEEEELENDELEGEETNDSDYSWVEAVKSHSVFYGDRTIIALICRELVRNNGNGVAIRPIKWKIATKEGGRWVVVEELPLNCDVEAAFGEYGLPMEFTPSKEYFCDDDAIRP